MNGKKKMIDSFKKAAVIGAGTTGRGSIRLYWAGSRNPWSAAEEYLGKLINDIVTHGGEQLRTLQLQTQR
jgi:hypothetical protein